MNQILRNFRKLMLLSAIFIIHGCFTMKVEPIKIEVTVKIQVEKDLNSFFDEIDSATLQEKE